MSRLRVGNTWLFTGTKIVDWRRGHVLLLLHVADDAELQRARPRDVEDQRRYRELRRDFRRRASGRYVRGRRIVVRPHRRGDRRHVGGRHPLSVTAVRLPCFRGAAAAATAKQLSLLTVPRTYIVGTEEAATSRSSQPRVATSAWYRIPRTDRTSRIPTAWPQQ